MSTDYKPFKNLSQMVKQPAGKHWFAREKLTKEKGFNSKEYYGKKREMAEKMAKHK